MVDLDPEEQRKEDWESIFVKYFRKELIEYCTGTSFFDRFAEYNKDIQDAVNNTHMKISERPWDFT